MTINYVVSLSPPSHNRESNRFRSFPVLDRMIWFSSLWRCHFFKSFVMAKEAFRGYCECLESEGQVWRDRSDEDEISSKKLLLFRTTLRGEMSGTVRMFEISVTVDVLFMIIRTSIILLRSTNNQSMSTRRVVRRSLYFRFLSSQLGGFGPVDETFGDDRLSWILSFVFRVQWIRTSGPRRSLLQKRVYENCQYIPRADGRTHYNIILCTRRVMRIGNIRRVFAV